MKRYRPIEALGPVGRRCGLYVDVEARGEVEDVIEMRLDDSEVAQILSDTGEGIYVASGESNRQLKIQAVAARIACDQCGDCRPEDFSVMMETPMRIDEAGVAGLEANYAEGVFELANARLRVLGCILTQPQ